MPNIFSKAGFLKRLYAFNIDHLLLYIIPGSLLYLYAPEIFEDIKDFFISIPEQYSYWLIPLILHSFMGLVFAPLYYYKGASPGKLLLQIQVVNNQGGLLSYPQILFREIIGKMGSSIIFYLGYFLVAFRSDHKGLHDLLTESQVIEGEKVFSGKSSPVNKLVYISTIVVLALTFKVKEDLLSKVTKKTIVGSLMNSMDKKKVSNANVDEKSTRERELARERELERRDKLARDKEKRVLEKRKREELQYSKIIMGDLIENGPIFRLKKTPIHILNKKEIQEILFKHPHRIQFLPVGVEFHDELLAEFCRTSYMPEKFFSRYQLEDPKVRGVLEAYEESSNENSYSLYRGRVLKALMKARCCGTSFSEDIKALKNISSNRLLEDTIFIEKAIEGSRAVGLGHFSLFWDHFKESFIFNAESKSMFLRIFKKDPHLFLFSGERVLPLVLLEDQEFMKKWIHAKEEARIKRKKRRGNE